MNLKKPKFWDYKRPNFISYILMPFTIPIVINNFLLNRKKKKKSTDFKTICIGNIYVGGTGKTPTTLNLYQILRELNLKVIIAKKFYKSQIDERLILENKSNFITDYERSKIFEKLSSNDYEIVIFDDGLQDKNLDYDLKIVCFDSDTWIGKGCLIPSGPLREKLESLKKYDAVFIKNINKPKKEVIEYIEKNYQHIKVFNTILNLKNLEKINLDKKYLIFSGIGNPSNFRNLLDKYNFKIVKETVFPDHYNYTIKDIEKLISEADKLDAKIITTEKDFVKIPIEYQNHITSVEIALDLLEKENFINLLRSKKIYE